MMLRRRCYEMTDYTGQTIMNENGQNIEIIEFYGRNNKNEPLWLYKCPFCGELAYNVMYKIKKRTGCLNCKYQRSGAKKRLSDEYLQSVATQRNPNVEFVKRDKTKKGRILFHCKEHNLDFYIYKCNFLYNENSIMCPKCIKEKNAERQRLYSVDEISQKLAEYGYEWLNKECYQNASSILECKCKKCGTIKKLNYVSFLSGRLCKTCAGYAKKTNEQFRKQVYDLVGDSYTVLGEYVDGKTKIEIRHNVCGNKWYCIPTNILKRGNCCPFCKKSHGEDSIENFLRKNNIAFETQKKFDTLFGVGNGKLSYDFYLPNNNLLIEYQGKQHEISVEYFGGDENFQIRKEHDKRKRDFAANNNIELLEIWYWDFENIEKLLRSRLIQESA